MKPRKRIPAMSKKRLAESKIYAKLRQEFLKENPKCQMPQCRRKATDVHHAHGRGCNYLRADTYRALCRTCHQWVGMNPTMARSLGLLCPAGKWMARVEMPRVALP